MISPNHLPNGTLVKLFDDIKIYNLKSDVLQFNFSEQLFEDIDLAVTLEQVKADGFNLAQDWSKILTNKGHVGWIPSDLLSFAKIKK